MSRSRKLLTIGHSYAVALNRRLAHEMAIAGRGRWDVTAAAPDFVHGDLRPISFEPIVDEACNVKTLPMRWTRHAHVTHYSRRLKDLAGADWDLVHSWEEPFVLAGFQICHAMLRDVPLVFWTAQNLNKWYPPPFKWFETYCLRRCSGWLACGQTTVDAMAQRGYLEKPHRVIPLGVDVDLFCPDSSRRDAIHRRLGWDEHGPPVIGYLGRFVAEKGLAFLTQTLDALPTPWRALIVGGGALEARLREWARRYSDGRVQIVTNVPHAEVPAYLNAMDLLAAPSRTTLRWREQLGRMLIEGMACGTTVVGSDSGEIPYVIGDAGCVFPESNTASWVEGLAALLEAPKRRSELACRGRERAVAEFSWPVVADRHLNFFEELLEINRS